MKTKSKRLTKILLCSAATLAMATGMLSLNSAQAADPVKAPVKEAHSMPNMHHMGHITTQAQAEALKPGDSMCMVCVKCKDVMVQKVGTDNAHVKMMTVGAKMKCHGCDATMEVVATGKGEGKNAEVKHNCSKCGEDAAFCSAVKAGSGAMKDMAPEKK